MGELPAFGEDATCRRSGMLLMLMMLALSAAWGCDVVRCFKVRIINLDRNDGNLLVTDSKRPFPCDLKKGRH